MERKIQRVLERFGGRDLEGAREIWRERFRATATKVAIQPLSSKRSCSIAELGLKDF